MKLILILALGLTACATQNQAAYTNQYGDIAPVVSNTVILINK